ncbi:unnamed protein product [Ambrosiozyma monospora]|uniref:Unnamed protein product n=1 Tax=Ambrosiozyma monospora TaxID=43982 RepID=A0ACB5UCP3_AMBMO|nr:unnamed protein product [Ambrosiozyma monospora]
MQTPPYSTNGLNNAMGNMSLSGNGNGAVNEKISYKTNLIKNGWARGVETWDDVSEHDVLDIVGKDYFFVPSEYDRALFIIKLIERKLQTPSNSSFVTKLRALLNEDVIFATISADRLHELGTYRDINGRPYVSETTIGNALTTQFSLAKAIDESEDTSLDFDSPTDSKYYFYKDHVDFHATSEEIDKKKVVTRFQRQISHQCVFLLNFQI